MNNLRTIFLFLIMLGFGTISMAQFGISTRLNQLSSNGWDEIATQQHASDGVILDNSLEFAVDYWFRLKNQRIEFYPEIAYMKRSTSIFSVAEEAHDYSNTFWSFNLNTNIYVFDFLGDCNCPTFSKQGNLIKKGFFIQVSPGLSLINQEFDIPNNSNSGSTINLRLGLGIGLDIGVNDLITITPTVKYNYLPSVSWEGFERAHSPETLPPEFEESNQNVNFMSFGIRLGIRPDYLRSQRGFSRRR